MPCQGFLNPEAFTFYTSSGKTSCNNSTVTEHRFSLCRAYEIKLGAKDLLRLILQGLCLKKKIYKALIPLNAEGEGTGKGKKQ